MIGFASVLPLLDPWNSRFASNYSAKLKNVVFLLNYFMKIL